jgi:hypothetical protein
MVQGSDRGAPAPTGARTPSIARYPGLAVRDLLVVPDGIGRDGTDGR